jgi:hypothetical protein
VFSVSGVSGVLEITKHLAYWNGTQWRIARFKKWNGTAWVNATNVKVYSAATAQWVKIE